MQRIASNKLKRFLGTLVVAIGLSVLLTPHSASAASCNDAPSGSNTSYARLILNFNLAGQGNGSAGTVSFTINDLCGTKSIVNDPDGSPSSSLSSSAFNSSLTQTANSGYYKFGYNNSTIKGSGYVLDCRQTTGPSGTVNKVAHFGIDPASISKPSGHSTGSWSASGSDFTVANGGDTTITFTWTDGSSGGGGGGVVEGYKVLDPGGIADSYPPDDAQITDLCCYPADNGVRDQNGNVFGSNNGAYYTTSNPWFFTRVPLGDHQFGTTVPSGYYVDSVTWCNWSGCDPNTNNYTASSSLNDSRWPGYANLHINNGDGNTIDMRWHFKRNVPNPSAPTISTSCSGSAAQATISWTNRSSANHIVDIDADDSFGSANWYAASYGSATSGTAPTGYRDGNNNQLVLNYGQTYYVRVYYNSDGVRSPVATFQAPNCASRPPAPTASTFCSGGVSKVTINWNTVSGFSSYIVDIDPTDNFGSSDWYSAFYSNTNSGVAPDGPPAYTNSGNQLVLNPGQTYYFRVYYYTNTASLRSQTPNPSFVAQSCDQAPTAYIDGANCNNIWGNAIDQDYWKGTGKSIYVDIKIDGTKVATVFANGYRSDQSSGDQSVDSNRVYSGWGYTVPATYRDGNTHTVRAVALGVDSTGTRNGVNVLDNNTPPWDRSPFPVQFGPCNPCSFGSFTTNPTGGTATINDPITLSWSMNAAASVRRDTAANNSPSFWPSANNIGSSGSTNGTETTAGSRTYRIYCTGTDGIEKGPWSITIDYGYPKRKPYIQVVGDVHGGGSYLGGNCMPTSPRNPSVSGLTTSMIISSINTITDFAGGTGGALGIQSYGAACRPNLITNVQAYMQTIPATQILTVNSNATYEVNTGTGKLYGGGNLNANKTIMDFKGSLLTLGGADGVTAVGPRTIYVENGNVLISNKIDAGTSATRDSGKTLGLIVNGDVFIDKSVTNLGNVFIWASGRIHTCTTGTTDSIPNGANYNAVPCNTQLTISGMLMANDYSFLRNDTYATYGNAASGRIGSQPSEIINLSPMLFIAPPPGFRDYIANPEYKGEQAPRI